MQLQLYSTHGLFLQRNGSLSPEGGNQHLKFTNITILLSISYMIPPHAFCNGAEHEFRLSLKPLKLTHVADGED